MLRVAATDKGETPEGPRRTWAVVATAVLSAAIGLGMLPGQGDTQESPSTSASASAVPDTGGPPVASWAVGVAALVATASALVVGRIARSAPR